MLIDLTSGQLIVLRPFEAYQIRPLGRLVYATSHICRAESQPRQSRFECSVHLEVPEPRKARRRGRLLPFVISTLVLWSFESYTSLTYTKDGRYPVY